MMRPRTWLVAIAFALEGAFLATPAAQGTWQPAPHFSDRVGAGMAYDPVRERVVLFGGSYAQWIAQGTWEWDGRSWSLRRSPHMPPPRTGAAMSWDPNTGKILLFGGATKTPDGNTGPFLNDTWLWDGQDWQQIFPKNSPRPLASMGLAVDPLRRRVVLFGGTFPPRQVSNETWEWDGSDWTLMSPTSRPAPKGGVGFAFNWYSRKLLLAGGSDWTIPGPPRDYWEWDGNDWTKLQAPTQPTFRIASAVTDPFTGEVFLWANKGEPDGSASTMWRWGGQSWNPAPPALAEDEGSIVADTGRKRIHAIGGLATKPPLHPKQYTWEFDGSTWTKVWQQIWPKGLANAAYDPARQEFVAWIEERPYGDETWLYRLEEGWRKVTPKTMPSPRIRPHVLSMGPDGPVVLFGGQYGGYLVADEVFVWTGSDWSKRVYSTGPYSFGRATAAPNRQSILYYLGGGLSSNGIWELDLQHGWRQHPNLNPPSYRSTFYLCYDQARNRLVLFGGLDSQTKQFLNDTWEWDGQTWAQKTPVQSPAYRDGAEMIYVPSLGGVVLTNGAKQGNPQIGEFWLWDGSNWTHLPISNPVQPFPAMELPTSFVLDSDRSRLFAFFEQAPGSVWYLENETLRASQTLPRPGQAFSLNISDPRAKGAWGLVALSESLYPGIKLPSGPGHFGVFPLALDPLMQVSLGLGLLTPLDHTGAGSLPFGIPNDARLQGFKFHAAGLLFDPFAGILDATNSVTLEVVK